MKKSCWQKIRRSSLVGSMALGVLSSCTVGPDYKRPEIDIPTIYKEAPEEWKIAEPQDQKDKGSWWEIFNDPLLNHLQEEATRANHTIKALEAQYTQARTLVEATRGNFFPIITGNLSSGRTKPFSPITSLSPYNTHSTGLTASWEPDLWGNVRRLVESGNAQAEGLQAALENMRLSVQALLANSYFQIRILDNLQKLLDQNVLSSQQLLTVVKNRYKQGTVSHLEVLKAETAYKNAQLQATDNRIARGQFQHALAVLLGKMPQNFTVDPIEYVFEQPSIPLGLPSTLLERRPDIAQAERQMIQANAQIGVAITTFFPALTLSASGGFTSESASSWFSGPSRVWALGASLAATIFDSGIRSSQIKAAEAGYEQSASLYRQTVFSAFQEVEDQLLVLKTLNEEQKIQNETVINLERQTMITKDGHKVGINDAFTVLQTQLALYGEQQKSLSLIGRKMTALVELIKVIGGKW